MFMLESAFFWSELKMCGPRDWMQASKQQITSGVSSLKYWGMQQELNLFF